MQPAATACYTAKPVKIAITELWDRTPAAPGEHITLDLQRHDNGLVVDIDAPFHNDPAPPQHPGPTPRLWDYEVVELFLFGADGRYLEVELGPHGHYLVLQLAGVRTIVAEKPTLVFAASIQHGRWCGRAVIDRATLPEGLCTYNAHAIHGRPPNRRYLSAFPAGGSQPDFHRPEAARSLPLALRPVP